MCWLCDALWITVHTYVKDQMKIMVTVQSESINTGMSGMAASQDVYVHYYVNNLIGHVQSDFPPAPAGTS